jgi:hypothetical protein
MTSPGIYLVRYLRNDGDLIYATIHADTSWKAIDHVIEQERDEGFEVLQGGAELLCPDRLLPPISK